MRALLRGFFWPLLIGLVVVLVYIPGLHGPLVFDDDSSLKHNPSISIEHLNTSSLSQAALSGESGLLKRPIAYLSFAINYWIAGGFENTFPFKVTNLLIHLINSILVFWLTHLLIGTRRAKESLPFGIATKWLPIATSGLWAVHPINLTPVLYVVQRMTSLSAMFVLLGLILFVQGRQLLEKGRAYRGFMLIVGGFIISLTLGLASKENAVLLLLFVPLIEFVFFDLRLLDPTNRHRLIVFYLLAAVIPVVTAVAIVAWQTELLLSTYDLRHYTLLERLLTESRVLWNYVYLIIVPRLSTLTLFHDDIEISTGIISPLTTAVAIFSWALVLSAAFRWRKTHPIYTFAIFWFLAAHSLESSAIGLEIAHEHRNYLPSFGLLFGFSAFLLTAFKAPPRRHIGRWLLLAIGTCFSIVTFLRAHVWANDGVLIESMAHHHPNSARSQAMLGELYAVRRLDGNQAAIHYKKASQLDPYETGYLIRIAQISHGSISAAEMNLLSERIKNDLKARPLSAYAMSIINNLPGCVTAEPRACAPIYRHIIEWLKATAQSPHITETARQNTILHWYNTARAHSDYSAALAAADYGRLKYPTDLMYTLMTAEARIYEGDFALAENLISSVLKSSSPLPASTKQAAEDLRAALEKHRKPRM